jgi:hypothetical protein
MKANKPRLPEGLDLIADEADRRRVGRYCPPRIRIEKPKNGSWRIVSPYAKEDEERWWSLLGEAFATRDPDVILYFFETLGNLCPKFWDDSRREWAPREVEFNALLAVVGSVRPANEAQAAYAAQLGALHLSAMKLAERTTEYADPRSAAILNKTVRAFGDGLERIARLQGKIAPRTIHQTFEVHKHEHVHFRGGTTPNGGQPHRAATSAPVECAALPRPCADGSAVQMPCGERQEGLPGPWWGARLWRSLWRA